MPKKILAIVGLIGTASFGAIPVPQNGQWVASSSHYNENTGQVWYESEFIVDDKKEIELISADEYRKLGEFGAKEATPKSKRLIELLTKKAEASVSIQATSTGGIANTITSRTWSHTIAGTETVLVVCAGARDSTGTNDFYVSSATYNGVAMTKQIEGKDATDRVASTLLSLINPTTGAHNVVVNWNGSNQTGYASAISFNGADQTTPVEGMASTSASSNSPSVSVVTSSTDTIITDCGTLDSSAATITVDASQTQQWLLNGSRRGFGSTESAGSPATTVMSWSSSEVQVWHLAGIAVKSATLAASTESYVTIFE